MNPNAKHRWNVGDEVLLEHCVDTINQLIVSVVDWFVDAAGNVIYYGVIRQAHDSMSHRVFRMIHFCEAGCWEGMLEYKPSLDQGGDES